MAREPSDDSNINVHDGSPGGGGKWIAAAVVAAVLAAGGYYAWTNLSPALSTDVASNEPYSTPLSEAAVPSGPPSAYNSSESAPPQQGAASPRSAAPSQSVETSPSVAPPPSARPSPSSSTASAAPETQTAPAAAAPVQRSATTRAGAPVQHAAPPVQTASTPVPPDVAAAKPASLTPEDSDAIIVEARRPPLWAHAPNARRMSIAYPIRAREAGREGEASLHCVILADGALNCARVSETPADAGFGSAALRVAQMYRHAPVLRDGKDAVGSPVDLRVIFRIGDSDRG